MNTTWSLYYEDSEHRLAGTIKVRPFIDIMGDGMYHAEPILQSLYKMIKYPVQGIPDSIKDGVTASCIYYPFADLLIDSYTNDRSITINTSKASLLAELYSYIVNDTLKVDPNYYGVDGSRLYLKIKDVHMKGSYKVSFQEGRTQIGVGKYIKFNKDTMDTSFFSKKSGDTRSYRGFDMEGLDKQILDLIYIVFFYELTGFTGIEDSTYYANSRLGIVYLPQVLGNPITSLGGSDEPYGVLVDDTYFCIPEHLGTGISLSPNKGCIRKSILNEFRDTLFHGVLHYKCVTDSGSYYVFDPYDSGDTPPVRLNKYLVSLELLLNSNIQFKTLVLEYPGTNLTVFQQSQLAHILSRLNSELGIHIWMVTPNVSPVRDYFITLLSAMHFDEDYSNPDKKGNTKDYWKIGTNDDEVCYVTGNLKSYNTSFHKVQYCKDFDLFGRKGTYYLSPYSVVLSDESWLYKH